MTSPETILFLAIFALTLVAWLTHDRTITHRHFRELHQRAAAYRVRALKAELLNKNAPRDPDSGPAAGGCKL